MKILVIGGGGREHALVWCLARSPEVTQVLVAPGNAGTEREPKVRNLSLTANATLYLVAAAKDMGVDQVVIGPEAPLVAGLADALEHEGIPCFGPKQENAKLEGSKVYAKEFMQKHGIATPEAEVFDEIEAALGALDRAEYPLVIKANGLAAGKGVIIAEDRAAAAEALQAMLVERRFGAAGEQVLIERFVPGRELSLMVMAAGRDYQVLATSQDYKRALTGDKGPNTGGMGAHSPADLPSGTIEAALTQVIEPLLGALVEAKRPYLGFLYAGLMLPAEGGPAQVLEFNCRLGDPETQVVLPRLKSDLALHVQAALENRLGAETLRWDERPAVGVVLAAENYPSDITKGAPISGLDKPLPADTQVFHAGTAERDGRICVDGGRVMCATALGDSYVAAREKAYQAAAGIEWEGRWYREDIGGGVES